MHWIAGGKQIRKETLPKHSNYTETKFERGGGKEGFYHYGDLQYYIAANARVSVLQFNKLSVSNYLALVTTTLFINLVH